jgi:hypothetical protein
VFGVSAGHVDEAHAARGSQELATPAPKESEKMHAIAAAPSPTLHVGLAE